MTLESEDGNSIYTDTILFFDFDYNATTGTTRSAIGSEDSSSLDIEDMYKKKERKSMLSYHIIIMMVVTSRVVK